MSPNAQRVVAGVVVASAGLLTFVGVREGREYVPYRDIGGVWTVCDGVIKGVIPGRTYTKPECDALLQGEVERHGRGVLACTQGVQLKQHEYDAFADLAYNVGIGAVCGSCLPAKECLGDLIRAGKMAQACERILAYAKTRIDGVLRDCSDPQWKCRGLWLRRKADHDACTGKVPITSLGVGA